VTNIAAGTHEQSLAVASSGAITIFLKLLHSPNPDCREQACWGVGNIAGDCVGNRDKVLDSGAVQEYIHLFEVMNIDILSKTNFYCFVFALQLEFG
jgi:hypothetical protein